MRFTPLPERRFEHVGIFGKFCFVAEDADVVRLRCGTTPRLGLELVAHLINGTGGGK